jgi:hypothetical protein
MLRRRVGQVVGALLLLGLVGGSAAGPPFFATRGKLTRVGTGWAGEGLYLTLDVVMQDAKPPCVGARSAFMALAAPQYRETNAIVLLALAQARPITVYYDDGCWGTETVKLAAVSIETAP